MALGKDRKLTEDDPSEVVLQVRKTLNQVLDQLDTLVSGLAGAADVAAINTLAGDIDTSELRKVLALLERPNAPAVP